MSQVGLRPKVFSCSLRGTGSRGGKARPSTKISVKTLHEASTPVTPLAAQCEILGNRRNTVSRVLFQNRELTEFYGKLGEFCEKLGEFAFTHK